MRLKTFMILPVLLMMLLSACSAAQPTQDATAAQSTSVPTVAISADNAKEATPTAGTSPDSTPYPAEQPTAVSTASEAASSASSYPAPDPATGLAPVLQSTVRFNIPQVDQMLDVLFGDKSAELPSRIIYEQAPCTMVARRMGPPQCATNEPEGTKVEVLPRIGGEGTFLRKDDANLKGLLGNIDLLGVYKVKEDFQSVEYYPSGSYALVIRLKSDNMQVVVLQVNDKGIVRADYTITPPSLSQADVAGYMNPAK